MEPALLPTCPRGAAGAQPRRRPCRGGASGGRCALGSRAAGVCAARDGSAAGGRLCLHRRRRAVAAAGGGGGRRQAAGGGRRGAPPLSLSSPRVRVLFFFFSSPTAAPLRLHSVRPVWPLPVVAHAGTSRRPRGCLSLPQSAAPPAHRPGGGRHSVRGGLGDTREETPPAAVSPWGGAPQKGRLPRRQRRRHGPGRRSRPAAERDARHVTGALPTRAARGSRWGASAGQRPAVTVCCRHRPPPPPPQPPRRAHPTVTATRRPPPHRRGW